MEILSPRERSRLERKTRKAQKKINHIFKKKLRGWQFEKIDNEGNIVFRKDMWVLDLLNKE